MAVVGIHVGAREFADATEVLRNSSAFTFYMYTIEAPGFGWPRAERSESPR